MKIHEMGEQAFKLYQRKRPYPFASMHRVGDTLRFASENEYKKARSASAAAEKKFHMKFRGGKTVEGDWAITRIE